MMANIKEKLKPVAWVVLALFGYGYDWFRFSNHGGARYRPSPNRRQFSVVKVYHRLEKSLALAGRVPGRGRGAVRDLMALLKPSVTSMNPLHYQEEVGLKVLQDFVEAEANHTDYSSELKFLEIASKLSGEVGGVEDLDRSALIKGQMSSPENFFHTRHSIRNFLPSAVSTEVLERAVTLASSTPSVCNRQSWHVYHTSDPKTISKALSFQNGNQGFSERIPTLLVITADLNAFDTSAERYQHWIDGGMFSMTLVWAFHALGLGACCLNWSKGVRDDLRFRRALQIQPQHSILMMIAVGEIPEEITVCVSARTPTEQKMSELKTV